MGKSTEFDYLNEERVKLWHKINSVETNFYRKIDEEISKKPSDFSDEAKQASRKTSEYRNRSENAQKAILSFEEDARANIDKINSTLIEANSIKSQIENLKTMATSDKDLVNGIYDDVNGRYSTLEEQIEKIEEIFADEETLTEKVEKIEQFLNESTDTNNKIEALHKTLLARKSEIDQAYLEIYGYEETNSEGVNTKVAGLKNKLENSYKELDSEASRLSETVKEINTTAIQNFENFVNDRTKINVELVDKWENNFQETHKKIQDLLPNALTAGLSYAYSEKKDAEIEESKKLNVTFTRAIWGLVCISLIPFIVSIVSIFQHKSLDQTLLDIPRLVLSILPLYVPILWVAYSSSKKMNLSKRLSEEYSHKEVLSKTFEGLSTQINSIGDEKISGDLRNKLLYNILEVSSENPGKLISDYNKADHPLMDALDKSVKLATAFEKLEKMPGFKKLAQTMEKKSKTLLSEENKKANKGMSLMTEDDNSEEQSDNA